MKPSHKSLLKSILLTSMTAIGVPKANATGASIVASYKKESDESPIEASVSETLNTGVLSSHPSFGEMMGHTSHSSHSSHGSHTSSSHGSHASHTSSVHSSHLSHTSSAAGGTTSSVSDHTTRNVAIGLGATAAGVGLYCLIHHIVKVHKARVKERTYLNSHRVYGSRELSPRSYGNDVDEMQELLVMNDVLNKYDKAYSQKKRHYKYTRKVKRAVKRMQKRMGYTTSSKVSTAFLKDLKTWKTKRSQLQQAIQSDSLNIEENREARLATAILLVEKGYLDHYDASHIMEADEIAKIVKAYHLFQREHGFPESSWIDERTLRLLNSLPNKQR